MTRYEAREMTDSGWGRSFYAERLSTVRDVVIALPAAWRVQRQRWTGRRWTKDGGNAEWWVADQVPGGLVKEASRNGSDDPAVMLLEAYGSGTKSELGSL